MACDRSRRLRIGDTTDGDKKVLHTWPSDRPPSNLHASFRSKMGR